jgi:hypothetical protein
MYSSPQNKIHIYTIEQPPGLFLHEAARLPISNTVLPFYPEHSGPSLLSTGLLSRHNYPIDRNELDAPPHPSLCTASRRRPAAKLLVGL